MSVPPQRNATLSHMQHAIEPLVDMGYDVAVFLYTKRTIVAHLLVRWYDKHTAQLRLVPQDSAQMEIVFDALQHVCEGSTWERNAPLEGVLVLRFDLLLKPRFAEVFMSLDQKARSRILFSFRTWKHDDVTKAGNPRVADMIYYIPERFCSLFARLPRHDENNNKRWHGHDLWDDLKPLVGSENLGFMLSDEQHDSDPAKDRNPLYKLAQRPEGPEVDR
jgi:hypothetical protein